MTKDYEDPDPVEKGKELGLTVFSGRSGRLLLFDLDTPEAFQKHMQLMWECPPPYKVLPYLRTTSKGGVGQHVYYVLPAPLGAAERLALQLSLGSDPVREGLAQRHRTTWGEPSFLFETPTEAYRVRAWLKVYGLAGAEES